MNISLLNFRPPRIAMALTAVAVAIHLLTPLGAHALYSSQAFGAVVITIGFLAMMWAWWQFKTHQVAICPSAETDHLITDGIYGLTRNPMYLGMMTMLFGLALTLGTLPFYAVAVSFFLIIETTFCPYEEAKLTTAFGESFSRYATRVRRWL